MFVSFPVCKLMCSGIVSFSWVYKPRWFDLFCTSCMRRVFTLWWHHRENKRLLMYRNIKSQDDFIDNKTAVYNQHFKNHSVRLQIRTIGLLISTWVKIKEKAPLPTKGYGHAVGLSCTVKGKSASRTYVHNTAFTTHLLPLTPNI